MDIGGVVEFYPSRRIVTRFDAGDTIVHVKRQTVRRSGVESCDAAIGAVSICHTRPDEPQLSVHRQRRVSLLVSVYLVIDRRGLAKDGVGNIDIEFHVSHAHDDVAVGNYGTITPSTFRGKCCAHSKFC